jgi:hypothetical protein
VRVPLASDVRHTLPFSFSELEQAIWGEAQRAAQEHMAEVLQQVDAQLAEQRDKKRFVLRGVRSRTIATVFGAVTFRRRYYLDLETGTYVALLDEALSLEGYERIRATLEDLAVAAGVTQGSYRKAAAELGRISPEVQLSHETVRRKVVAAGEAIAAEEARRQEQGEGERKVAHLFLEVDGLHVALQRSRQRTYEQRVLVVHEGWEPIDPRGKAYRLRGRQGCIVREAEEPWEEMSRYVYARYDLRETTVVIIWVGISTGYCSISRTSKSKRCRRFGTAGRRNCSRSSSKRKRRSATGRRRRRSGNCGRTWRRCRRPSATTGYVWRSAATTRGSYGGWGPQKRRWISSPTG